MKSARVIIMLLITYSGASAMQCFSHSIPLKQCKVNRFFTMPRPYMPQEFDPEKVLVWERINTVDVPVTNYKHIIAAPQDEPLISYGEGVKIAVIDTGLNLEQDHPLPLTPESKMRFHHMLGTVYSSIKHNIMEIIDQEQMHTINVCNIIAGPDGQGIAPKVKLDVFGLYLSDGQSLDISGDGKAIADCIREAIQNKNHFINMSVSLCYRHPLDSPFFSSEATISNFIIKAFFEAKKAGVGVILAAGNKKTSMLRRYSGFDKLLVDMEDSLLITYGTTYEWREGGSYPKRTLVEDISNFSNDCDSYEIAKYGISAPSCGLMLKDDGGDQLTQSGTSYAAPQVTAAAGLLKGLHPHLTSVEIFRILKASARRNPLFEEKYRNFRSIPGVLHIKNAINMANGNGE